MPLTLKGLRKATGNKTREDHEKMIREIEQRTGKPVKRIRIPKHLFGKIKLGFAPAAASASTA